MISIFLYSLIMCHNFDEIVHIVYTFFNLPVTNVLLDFIVYKFFMYIYLLLFKFIISNIIINVIINIILINCA